MNKKMIIWLLVFMLSVLTAGCHFREDDPSGPSSEFESSEPVSSEEEPVVKSELGNAFAQLTDRQKEIYKRILAASNKMNQELIPLPAKSIMEDADKAFNAVMDDNPMHFWLSRSFSLHTLGDVTSIKLSFIVESNEKREAMIAKVDEAVAKAMKQIAAATNNYEKELILHDWLLPQVTYSNDAAVDKSGSHATAYTVYGSLVEGQAVCEGYARAMQLLLTRAGISCSLIYGTGNGVEHMWNVVNLEGQNYHLDPTWNDISNIDGDQSVTHAYFNITDQSISADHADFETQNATSVKYNFFTVNGTYFESYSNEAKEVVTQALAAGAFNGRKVVEIRFASKKAYQEARAEIIDKQGFAALLTNANKLLKEPNINTGTIQFSGADSPVFVLSLIMSLK